MTEKNEMEKPIPKATIKRIPLYYRYLKLLSDSGMIRIKSKEFSQLIQVPSATIRRDFSHFGELGRSGYGYDVSYLLEVFGQILNIRQMRKIIVVGAGNLGHALIKNNFNKDDHLEIVGAFDNDPKLIGTDIAGIPVYPLTDMKKFIRREKITVAITTVPSKEAQGVVNELAEVGVTAILNFASGRVKVPDGVRMQYIDLTNELQSLIYFDDHMKKVEKQKGKK